MLNHYSFFSTYAKIEWALIQNGKSLRIHFLAIERQPRQQTYRVNHSTSKFCIVFVNYVHSSDVCIHSFIHLFVIYFELLFFRLQIHLFWCMFASRRQQQQQRAKKVECNIFHFRRVEFEQRDGLKSDFGCSWCQVKMERNEIWQICWEQTEERQKTRTRANRIAMRFFLLLFCIALPVCACYITVAATAASATAPVFFPTFNF